MRLTVYHRKAKEEKKTVRREICKILTDRQSEKLTVKGFSFDRDRKN